MPTFFTPRAFDVVRPDAERIEYDPEAWVAVGGLAQSLVRNGLPQLANTAIVFRYAVPGPGQPRDLSVHNIPKIADEPAEYMPLFIADVELAKPAIKTPERVSLQVIMGTTQKPFEIAIKDGDLVGGLIRTLAEPPIDDQKLFASPSAWLRVLTAPSKGQQDEFAGQVRERFGHVIQKVPRS